MKREYEILISELLELCYKLKCNRRMLRLYQRTHPERANYYKERESENLEEIEEVLSKMRQYDVSFEVIVTKANQ